MSKCTITIYGEPEEAIVVSFEGQTVIEALHMKAEYLMHTVGATSDAGKGEARDEGDIGVAPAPTPSFVAKLKGGE